MRPPVCAGLLPAPRNSSRGGRQSQPQRVQQLLQQPHEQPRVLQGAVPSQVTPHMLVPGTALLPWQLLSLGSGFL